ncbi:MAG: carboxypeptidase regulatory-like domain-containing protein [Bryobacteraceae bacterium]|nr:carboxypeptidase regulatory-like domain-containing protein [Bryobacteraceae bacterium]
MNHTLLRSVFALALVWLPCIAQSTGGRISGSVQDSTGALIPGAEVTVQSVATSQRLSMTTNGSGQFVFYPLQAETYRLTAAMAGFRELAIDGIRLEVGANLIHSLTLEIGTSQQEVTVSASSVPIISQSPSVEGTISEQQTASLPLNGRSFDDLVLLTAGAVDNRLAGGGNDPGPYSVNGNRSYGNNFLVDGVSNNNVFQPQAAAAVSIDAIREFKVISGVPPAEYGQAAAAVSVVTRSGTNRYHGNVYEYFRGTVMQPRDPFNTVGTQPYAEHRAGGSLGGPVRLPRYNGKHRTFFFTNYEAGRLKSNATRVVSVPRPKFWKGGFSALLSRNIQLRDPLIAGRPPIPENRLDTYMGGSRINATALKLQPLFGSPDRPGYVNNAARFPEETNNGDQVTARIDQLLPKNHSISGRLIYTDGNLHQPWGLGTPGPASTQYSGSRNLMLTWTAPVGTRAVNEFKFGWSKVTRQDRFPGLEE